MIFNVWLLLEYDAATGFAKTVLGIFASKEAAQAVAEVEGAIDGIRPAALWIDDENGSSWDGYRIERFALEGV